MNFDRSIVTFNKTAASTSNMTTYCHSGSLGDLIYSLVIPKHFGEGNFYVKLHSIDHTTQKYGYAPQHVSEYHLRRLTDDDFYMLAPLLEVQPYISSVIPSLDSNLDADYDLDKFRGVMWRTFTGNYLEGYYKTFSVPYTPQDIIAPWLTVAKPTQAASIVVTRTFRYRNPSSVATWKRYTEIPGFSEAAVFIGLPEEHDDFEELFKVKVPYFKCDDFLEMAQVIAGCDLFIGNQTFAYSLAQGLGKPTSLECIPDRMLAQNECYFPRPDCFYF